MTEYFLKAFGKQSTISVKTQIAEEFTEVFFKELATACAINMVANTIGNSSDFMQHFISNLCYDNEALIVEMGGYLYVADSFCRRAYAFYEDVFSGITIGDLTLQRSYTSGEVIYMQLNNIDARRRLEGSFTSYGQTVAKAVRNMLRQGSQKGILNIDANTSQQKDFQEK